MLHSLLSQFLQNTYDYTAGYQGGAGATVTVTQNTAIVNPKSAQ